MGKFLRLLQQIDHIKFYLLSGAQNTRFMSSVYMNKKNARNTNDKTQDTLHRPHHYNVLKEGTKYVK